LPRTAFYVNGLNMFRVLHVFDVSIPMRAGYTFPSRSILEQQRALGWETFHITSSKQDQPTSYLDVESVDGFEFHRTRPGVLHLVPLARQYDVIRQLKQRIVEVAKEKKVDLIHAHSPCLIGLAGLSAARQLGIPFAYECRAFWEDASVDTGKIKEHGLQYRAIRKLESKVFSQADPVFCISKGLYGDILDRGVPADRITMIPNAANIDRFQVLTKKDESLNSQLHLKGKFVLGLFGSFYAYEGIDQTIAVLPALLKHNSKVHLLLLGGGNEEANLKEQVKSLNLEASVSFIGRVPHTDIPKYSSLVDAFIFPRRSIRLTNTVRPLKPLEAMAQGRLVIASDVVGREELIEHDKTGFLFNADDLESLIESVKKAMVGGEHAKAIFDNALEFVTTDRNWKAIASRYKAVYKSLVEGRTSIERTV
jgi:PEP-CTERM/exosortase A-associated glycosyltransferase